MFRSAARLCESNSTSKNCYVGVSENKGPRDRLQQMDPQLPAFCKSRESKWIPNRGTTESSIVTGGAMSHQGPKPPFLWLAQAGAKAPEAPPPEADPEAHADAQEEEAEEAEEAEEE